MRERLVKYFVIGTFVTLYFLVSCISTIHVIDFFNLSNPSWLSISLAIAFEVGAAASLASLVTLEKMNKFIVWILFIILTAMQAMGNTYYAYVHLNNFQGWIELFGLVDEELIYQKRVLSIVSGAILPIVALGFIKSLVDYIKPAQESAGSEKSIESSEGGSSVSEADAVKLLPADEPYQEKVNEPVIEEQNPEESKIDNFISIDSRIARGLK